MKYKRLLVFTILILAACCTFGQDKPKLCPGGQAMYDGLCTAPIQSLRFIEATGTVIMTCKFSPDGTLHDCKILEGHTLDEVMQLWQNQHYYTDADYKDLNHALVNAVTVIENLRDDNEALRRQLWLLKHKNIHNK